MNAKELLTKAKVILQAEHPFFSYLLFYCKFHPIPKGEKKGKFNLPVETIAIDKHLNVYYNEDFVEQNAEYIKGLLVHEIMHVVLKHHPRFEDFKDDEHQKHQMLANVSMDAVINLSLFKMAIRLPSDVIKPDKQDGYLHKLGNDALNPKVKVDGSSWEEVYMELKKQMKEAPQGYQGDMVAGSDEGEDKDKKEGESPDTENGQLSESQVDEIIQEATNYSKLQGKLPAELERLLDEVYNTTTPWQKILKQNMQSFIPYDFNYKRPNRRAYGMGTFMPQQNKRPSVKIYAAIDTSGSVSQEEMNYFISELYTICKQFMILELTVMFCDAEVHQTVTIKDEKDINLLKPSGYGGTDFKPVFTKLNKEFKAGSQDILVYFTDGWGSFPNKKPKYQTIWMTTDAKAENYPFGSVIKCNMPTKTEF